MTLRISPDLALPDDFATEGVAVIGMRGSGKSNSEVRWAEVLYDAGIPFVAVDPKGDWDGIRSSADGKRPGLPIPVFGGLRGDFPLEAASGKVVADLLVDENLSAVLDVSMLSKTNDRLRFLVDFFGQLMHRHQLEPQVRNVILEEAHTYIPQNVDGTHAKVKAAASSILLEGRAWGLGCWACSQRPARIHKDVLEEVGSLLIHRIGAAATNDLRTIKGWIKDYDDAGEIGVSLTRLRAGEAWVLSPEFLDSPKRVQVDRRRTFDSASTPKVGAVLRRPSTMADIDAAAIKEAMADSIERAKAEDPKELRREIAALRKELASRPTERIVETVTETVEVPVLNEDMLGRLDDTFHALGTSVHKALREELGTVRDDVRQLLAAAVSSPARSSTPVRSTVPVSSPRTREQKANRTAPRRDIPAKSFSGDVTLGGGAPRKVLVALATYPDGLTQRRAAALAGIAKSKSTLRNALSTLRSRGLIEGSDLLRITDAGMVAVGDSIDVLPSGPELLSHWRSKLGEGAPRKLFDVLVETWPERLSPDELAERAEIEPGTSTMRNAMSRLRTLGLVSGATADDDLMEAIR